MDDSPEVVRGGRGRRGWAGIPLFIGVAMLVYAFWFAPKTEA